MLPSILASFLLTGTLFPVADLHQFVVGYVDGRPVQVVVCPIGGQDKQGKPLRLQCEAAEHWADLTQQASLDGVEISVNYAFRTYRQQKRLYKQNPDLAGKPGHSNHQAGISVDIHYDRKVLRWMRKNASTYGFISDVRGEPWHWTFVGDGKISC